MVQVDVYAEARAVLHKVTSAALAVTDAETGGPYASLVNVAVDADDCPLLLLSQLARHTRALQADGRAALLVHDVPTTTGDQLTALRFTLLGTMQPTESAEARQRYLARHPHAAGYASFADFSLWRFLPTQVHMVAGFGRIQTVDWGAFRQT